MFGRFERIVVHSERGRQTLAEFGVPAGKLRVIPHPVFPSDPRAARRRAHGARARDGAPLQADRALGRGRPSSRSAPRSSPANRSGRCPLSTARSYGSAISRRLRARACARRLHRRRLPLPRRARPERGAAAGARRRGAGRRLRRRRSRRSGRDLRRGSRRPAR